MKSRLACALALSLMLSACADNTPPARDLADLPAARTSWSLAAATTERGLEIFGFQGMGGGLSRSDTSNEIWAYSVRDDAWRSVGKFPTDAGRLSTSATLVGRGIWVGGGYVIEEDGTENTMDGDFAFDPETGTLDVIEGIGARIDDTVALPWQTSHVLYVGGWMQHRTSSDVQVFDIKTGAMTLTTQMPIAIAGHAGAAIDGHIVICDGMTADRDKLGKQIFAMSNKCFLGIQGAKIEDLKWEAIPAHPGKPRFRMAAAGTRQHGARVVFAGGSEQLYRFDGKTFDGKPVSPSAEVFSFDIGKRSWHVHAPLPQGISDIRTMPEANGELFVMGGMREGGLVSQRAFAFRLSKPTKPE